ncbi:mRNA cleavage and polyadenylation specificity factor complex subunit [Schizosaccharomyces japonicus yFS275]|uniref:mRNA cleavage and polyadenylation specificity factor complex subunit n=1 Tax=Schizosaccharomyces japonicus (strain yFS275 / FY16936) TaxID=402676 RepID=B6JX34_SCHJY|nr:mRNA cleavage and polyadenylation specificity factor complex subunit [Schizosaccharomyces japonicus yFS275]EEB05935.1 mRNA cleavage and polyadenylation specificity factor complex subunit [Schizosaccharomyces japonicus yFS275]
MSNADESRTIDEDDEYLYGESYAQASGDETHGESTRAVAEGTMAVDGETDEDDSDIEFIIDTKPGERAEPPGASSAGASNVKFTQRPAAPEKAGVEMKSTEIKESSENAPKIDIDKVPMIDGKSIYDVDLESYEDKPWRKPGADITDYFNYGFDEFTWAAYCTKQSKIREDYTPQKVLSSMTQLAAPTDLSALPPEVQAMMAAGGFPPMPPMPSGPNNGPEDMATAAAAVYGGRPGSVQGGANNQHHPPQRPPSNMGGGPGGRDDMRDARDQRDMRDNQRDNVRDNSRRRGHSPDRSERSDRSDRPDRTDRYGGYSRSNRYRRNRY